MLLLSLIGLSYVGAGVLVVGMVLLGGGLVRRAGDHADQSGGRHRLTHQEVTRRRRGSRAARW